MSAHILIVNDEETRRQEIRNCLEPLHQVVIVDCISAAIDSIKAVEKRNLNQNAFDLIICAVHINGSTNLSVFDFLKWTKGNPQVRNVPFILLDLEPSDTAVVVNDSIGLAGSVLGATGFVVINKFHCQDFLKQVEYYLPPLLCSGKTEIQSFDGNESRDGHDKLSETFKSSAIQGSYD